MNLKEHWPLLYIFGLMVFIYLIETNHLTQNSYTENKVSKSNKTPKPIESNIDNEDDLASIKDDYVLKIKDLKLELYRSKGVKGSADFETEDLFDF